MPKTATKKIIYGREVSQREFKQILVETVQKFPEGARVSDIVNTWGEDWDTPVAKHIIALTLTNMTNGGYLKRVEGQRGAFTATRAGLRGSDRTSKFENEVCKAIIESGAGIMKRADIEDIFISEAHPRIPLAKSKVNRPENGPKGNKRHKSAGDSMSTVVREGRIEDAAFRDAAASGLRHLLKTSHRIRRNTGKAGYYNVTYDQLLRTPQPGRNLSLMMRWVGESAAKRVNAAVPGSFASATDIFTDLRPIVFRNIARVVTALRELHNFSLEDVVASKPVAAALTNYKNADATRYLTYAKELQRKGHYETLPADGDVFAALLQDFERGDDILFMAIDSDLIAALAELYYCDAAALSLGIVLPDEANDPIIDDTDFEED